MLISGYAELDDQRRAIQAGLRFVRKPITFAQFEATMAEIVEHAAAGKAAIPCPFPYPLCRDVGRVVTLEAEPEPEPPLVNVTDRGLDADPCHAGGHR
jgi:hypothetical protein